MRTRSIALTAASTLAAAGLLVAAARADVPLSLSWAAPDGCPKRDAVVAEVERLVAAPVRNASPVKARATIVKLGARHHLHIVVETASGSRKRELDAPTCAELGDAAALLLALAVDPGAVVARKRPPETPADAGPAATPRDAGPDATEPPPTTTTRDAGPDATEPPPTATPAPRPAPPPPPVPAAPPEGRALRAIATAGLDQGTFAGATPSFRAGVAYAAPPLRLELLGTFTWGGRIPAPRLATAGGELWRAGGAVSVCLERALDGGAGRPPRGALCAGFEAGTIHAASYGVTGPGSASALWGAPTLGGLVRWPVARRLALRFDLSVAVPLAQLAFQIQGLGIVHQVGAVTAQGGVGIEADIF